MITIQNLLENNTYQLEKPLLLGDFDVTTRRSVENFPNFQLEKPQILDDLEKKQFENQVQDALKQRFSLQNNIATEVSKRIHPSAEDQLQALESIKDSSPIEYQYKKFNIEYPRASFLVHAAPVFAAGGYFGSKAGDYLGSKLAGKIGKK